MLSPFRQFQNAGLKNHSIRNVSFVFLNGIFGYIRHNYALWSMIDLSNSTYISWIFILNSNVPDLAADNSQGIHSQEAENVWCLSQLHCASLIHPVWQWLDKGLHCPSLRGPQGEPPIEAYDPWVAKGSWKSIPNPWVSCIYRYPFVLCIHIWSYMYVYSL